MPKKIYQIVSLVRKVGIFVVGLAALALLVLMVLFKYHAGANENLGANPVLDHQLARLKTFSGWWMYIRFVISASLFLGVIGIEGFLLHHRRMKRLFRRADETEMAAAGEAGDDFKQM